MRVPVTVLTGYLGAGKTTLLNHLLTSAHGRRLGVIINEFGEVGIDDGLVVGSDEDVVEMGNGCICCTVRGDLMSSVRALLARRDDLDGIVIETTGLADPGPVAQTFYADPYLAKATRLDAIVTLVDALHVEDHLTTSPECVQQIASADVLLLNKTDLVDEDDLARVEQRLRELNTIATLHRSQRSVVPLEAVLDLGALDLHRQHGLLPGGSTGDRHAHDHDHDHDHDHGHAHEHGVTSVSLDEPIALDKERVDMWLQFLASMRARDLYRVKGLLHMAGDDHRWVVQGVHRIVEGTRHTPWRDGEERRSRLVFIGRNLDRDELMRGFEACRVD